MVHGVQARGDMDMALVELSRRRHLLAQAKRTARGLAELLEAKQVSWLGGRGVGRVLSFCNAVGVDRAGFAWWARIAYLFTQQRDHSVRSRTS